MAPAPMLGDGAAVYTPGVSQRRAGATTYDLHDRLGTATKQTSASASVAATRTYDAFGMLVASTGTPKGPFGFAAASGYQEDGDSGLKLLGHRYYDPSTGRFLTRDPVKDGRNWYAYADESPTTETDPEGLQADDDGPHLKPVPPLTYGPGPYPGPQLPLPPPLYPYPTDPRRPLPPGDPPKFPTRHRKPKGPGVSGKIDWKHLKIKKIIISIPWTLF